MKDTQSYSHYINKNHLKCYLKFSHQISKFQLVIMTELVRVGAKGSLASHHHRLLRGQSGGFMTFKCHVRISFSPGKVPVSIYPTGLTTCVYMCMCVHTLQTHVRLRINCLGQSCV